MKNLKLLLLFSLAVPVITKADVYGTRLSGVGAVDATDVAVDDDYIDDDVDLYQEEVVSVPAARRVGYYDDYYRPGVVGRTAGAVADTVEAAASIPGAVLGGIFRR